MQHVDLFSGIGGFALAAQWAGFQTVAFVEIEPYAQEILKQNFGAVADAENIRPQGIGTGRQQEPDQHERAALSLRDRPRLYSDIRTFDGVRYAGATLLTGGFPCQPFSQAGKRRGKGDDRALWPEMFRVIRESKPRWVLAENVAGIINMELDSVLSDLEGEAYRTETFIIPACAVDARHRRDRVWIVGHAASEQINGKRRTPECGRDSLGWNQEAAQQNKRQASDYRLIGYGEALADTMRTGGQQIARGAHGDEATHEGRSAQHDNQLAGCGEALADATRLQQERQEQRTIWERAGQCGEQSTLADSKRQQPEGRYDGPEWWQRSKGETFGNGGQRGATKDVWWLPEPDVGRVAHGIPSRVDRLKGLGNAIVPQVAYEILKAIMQIEHSTGADTASVKNPSGNGRRGIITTV